MFFLWPTILTAVFPLASEGKLPTWLDLLPGFLAWVVLRTVRCPYSRLLGYAWLFWYFLGTVNVLASSIVLGGYYANMDLREATWIFFWGCFSYFVGLYFYEKFSVRKKADIYGLPFVVQDIPTPVRLFLIAFPFLWLLSIYLSLGYIPILRGGNIVDEMYEVKYGPLYSFGIWIVLSIFYCAYRSFAARKLRSRLAYGILVMLMIAASMADGKRAFAMVAVAGLVCLSFKLYGRKTWSRTLPLLVLALIGMYVGVLLMRIGNDAPSIVVDFYSKLSIVGVEFRDFVYSINYYAVGGMPNYSWAASTMGSLVNGFVLTLLGFDKSALTSLDSAHAWATMRNSNLGIRTGIICELWFAYGVWGMAGLVLLGYISGAIINRFKRARGTLGGMFWLAVCGVLFLLITSQSSFTAGVLPTLFYLYLMVALAKWCLYRRRV